MCAGYRESARAIGVPEVKGAWERSTRSAAARSKDVDYTFNNKDWIEIVVVIDHKCVAWSAAAGERGGTAS